jgi:mono/diheme cytochrome c family protein
MTKKIFKIIPVLSFALVLVSCSNKNTPLVYFPDMYFPVAYDPLMKAEDAYSSHKNEIPAFSKIGDATGLTPVLGTVARNKDGVAEAEANTITIPLEYNTGYDDSKSIVTSPLNLQNQAKDIQRGKLLYEKICVACHGTAGDGQGSIVVTGAYSGVPNYVDRQITVGSVHYVITNGRNAMGSFAGQLNAGDRWRVSMYVMDAFKGGVNSAQTAVATTAKIPSPATETNVTTIAKK